MVVWGEEPLGEYTVRSGYRVLLQVGSVVCPKCARGVENLEHDFRDCPFVAESLKSCSGIIVRDSRCRVIGSKEIVNEHVSSTFATEALACVRTLRLGMNLGIREVVVEDDSLLVKRGCIEIAGLPMFPENLMVLDMDCQGSHAAGGQGNRGGFWMNGFLSSWCFAIFKGDVITPHGSLSLSFDPNELPKGPMIQVRSKHFQEAISTLFLRCWKEDQLINDGVARANLLKIPCTLVQANFSSISAPLAHFSSNQLI
ncbi:hypothetical protein Goshw_021677 [Gossypium schwendimanii]|uniref:RNase H type-1 domain-containing protein n=1 Tax=Gossypium schwendimanii TaxID=34291 RepID=A0A7J9LB52_GOSSC|nr:hypothetical protein [Gossypium schwendimanii]